LKKKNSFRNSLLHSSNFAAPTSLLSSLTGTSKSYQYCWSAGNKCGVLEAIATWRVCQNNTV